jgi:hypothetical protein
MASCSAGCDRPTTSVLDTTYAGLPKGHGKGAIGDVSRNGLEFQRAHGCSEGPWSRIPARGPHEAWIAADPVTGGFRVGRI